ncbi:uncharacterized protein [Diadema setosum]|uniref:uncharacterized protein n=1 Tax=Diadema setosum TaxID=31175 RepID=UPI003B3A6C8D
MDFLLHTGGSLDFQTLTLNIKGEETKCRSHFGRPFVARIVVSQTTVIPAGHEAIVPGRVSTEISEVTGPVLIEPIEGGGELEVKGLILARALVNSESETFPIRVLNPFDREQKVQEGVTTATISVVDVESMNADSSHVKAAEIPEHLEDLFSRCKENVDPKYHKDVEKCLIDFKDVFSTSSDDIGQTDIIKHIIVVIQPATRKK